MKPNHGWNNCHAFSFNNSSSRYTASGTTTENSNISQQLQSSLVKDNQVYKKQPLFEQVTTIMHQAQALSAQFGQGIVAQNNYNPRPLTDMEFKTF